MSRGLQCTRQPRRQRKPTRPPTFERRHVTAPIGSLDVQPRRSQINVLPLQPNDFARPQQIVTAPLSSLIGHSSRLAQSSSLLPKRSLKSSLI
jgi:hypothetical protein